MCIRDRPSRALSTITEEDEDQAQWSPLEQDRAADEPNFRVVIRVRPPLDRERGSDYRRAVSVHGNDQMITVGEAVQDPDREGEEIPDSGCFPNVSFSFDRIYDQRVSQQAVYRDVGKPALLSALQGYNASIIAYGQTGSGKTYTMEGLSHTEDRGILPRTVEAIFEHIAVQAGPGRKFLVRAAYLQIYNEAISDLLKPDRQNLSIREDKKKGIYVEHLSEWVVRSPEEVYALMKTGASARTVAATKANTQSSRSHAIFIIIAEQAESFIVGEDGQERLLQHSDPTEGPQVCQRIKVGKLNLVDLAGSERVRVTGATGKRLEESRKINQSLSALGNVVSALTDPKARSHIPFRDAKLTRILEDSLGGNCKTTMMAMVSPALEVYHESMSTLKFANRAKHIQNCAQVNLDLDQKALLSKYEAELGKLREQLSDKSRTVVDKRKLIEVQERREQAEQDKLACITALEQQSRGLMQEKREKKQLEQRIKALQSQLLTGEDKHKSGDASESQHSYQSKLMEIERERESIEKDKAQVDRYKLLLMKQRDIMVALTSRLNERDELIAGLQDELDAYDQHQQLLEDQVDSKTATVLLLQRLGVQHAQAGQQQQPAQVAAAAAAAAGDLEAELREAEAERVSLEYLLKEKLETMVEVEIRERVHSHTRMRASQATPTASSAELTQAHEHEERRLSSMLLEKERQLRALHDEHATLREQRAGGGGKEEPVLLECALQQAEQVRTRVKKNYEATLTDFLRQKRTKQSNWRAERQAQLAKMMTLKQQCGTNDKERVALKTILELKIKGLVDSLSRSLCDQPGAQGCMREVQALNSLVLASAAALGFDQPNTCK
eukprot:TRINITY_DN6542_c0_g1_i1.p1 TRINITY_DN6542_c0_g1~~TRINITY_DN6542_c0_g1_i1.p1  ORF type:complete len:842 (-),score=356.70 TRINITY_DN6542_c0_g1_i1:123-2648(-)